MKSMGLFVFFLLSFVAFASADNVDGLVSIVREALNTWADGLNCIFVCNNLAGRYLTMCPLACQSGYAELKFVKCGSINRLGIVTVWRTTSYPRKKRTFINWTSARRQLLSSIYFLTSDLGIECVSK